MMSLIKLGAVQDVIKSTMRDRQLVFFSATMTAAEDAARDLQQLNHN